MAPFYCSFRGCAFEAAALDTLEAHIHESHREVLDAVVAQLPVSWTTTERRIEAYRAGLAWVCQQNAPLAHPAIDRRALKQFQRGDTIGAAVCFLCGRRFPYTNGLGPGDGIRWNRMVGPSENEILSLPLEEAQRTLSEEVYCQMYMCHANDGAQERMREALQDWRVRVQVTADTRITIIACAEDKVCRHRCPPHMACERCRAPLCSFCWKHLNTKKTIPGEALANDMLVFLSSAMHLLPGGNVYGISLR